VPKHAPKGPIKASTAEVSTEKQIAIAVLDHMPTSNPMTQGRLRCKATSKQSGKPCGRYAIPGGTVCYWHGGAAPQVKQAAMARLEAFQDRAISRLFALAEDETFPSTSYQAVRDVLDRTLGKPSENVKQEHSGEIIIKHEIGREE
jgi:hypothetical protein